MWTVGFDRSVADVLRLCVSLCLMMSVSVSWGSWWVLSV